MALADRTPGKGFARGELVAEANYLRYQRDITDEQRRLLVALADCQCADRDEVWEAEGLVVDLNRSLR